MRQQANMLLCFMQLAFCLQSGPALGAEEEPVLLRIDGNLIGLIEPVDAGFADRGEALRLVGRYHRLLPAQTRQEVGSLHDQMLRLIPDFEVAYAAADSAEITHVMSEIDYRLAAIHEIHAREYTQEVVEILQQAYQLILPTFGDD